MNGNSVIVCFWDFFYVFELHNLEGFVLLGDTQVSLLNVMHIAK